MKNVTNRPLETGGNPVRGAVLPIFVVGLPRSGTTLTRRILGHHPQILAQGETHYFEELRLGVRADQANLLEDQALRENTRWLYQALGRHRSTDAQIRTESWFTHEDLLARARSAGSTVGAIYEAFIQLQSEGSHGERYICDDTPRHLFQVPAILSWFPEAKIVACVRDLRDFMCSYKNYWKRTSAEESTRIRRLYHPVLSSLYWRSGVNLILKHRRRLGPTTLRVIQYEHLVHEPATTVADLCAFLGIAYEPSMLEIGESNSSFGPARSGIFTDSVGRWRTCLDPAETAIAQTIGKSAMWAFGYSPERVPLAPWRLFVHLVTTPYAFIRALWSNRARTGSMLSFLYRRASSAFRT